MEGKAFGSPHKAFWSLVAGLEDRNPFHSSFGQILTSQTPYPRIVRPALVHVASFEAITRAKWRLEFGYWGP